jgi:hypothetical protein
MTIVSSNIIEISLQKDGRRWIRERHIDHTGRETFRQWLADVGIDVAAALIAYADILDSSQNQAEINENIQQITQNGSTATVSTKYSTLAQNRAALRQAYRSATRTEVIMIGDFLNSLTDAQLKTLFGKTDAEVLTFRTNKLAPAATAAAAIRNGAGE